MPAHLAVGTLIGKGGLGFRETKAQDSPLQIGASAAGSIRDAGNVMGNDIECFASRPWDSQQSK